ncbi:MAG: putative selenium-dependent hydroxylase accessory protein YqeC, partial [Thermodesulfobacteriota bacterium]|nr:putative selenium-dependent hydroxylase accessory protein YqeC [Thermodesulfobacteriota bacterium]
MESLREILLCGNGGVISLVGAGGKTSLMFRIAREVSNAGESVLTTTTTRIMWPDKKQSSEIFLAATPKLVIEKASVLIKNNLHLTAASA